MEQTEQKHLKKQKSCRDQRPSQNNKTTPDEKSLLRKLQQKFFFTAGVQKKEEKQLVWKKEVISSSYPSGCFFFPHKSARAKSGGVFLIVGKYHLWYLTLNAR